MRISNQIIGPNASVSSVVRPTSQVMTLGETLEKIRSFDEESFICVEGGSYPSPSSNAVVIPINAGAQGPTPAGMEHFIEVYNAMDVLTAWSQHRGGQMPTAIEMIDAIYHFRKHNAYMLPEPTRGTRRPRSRAIVIAWFGAMSALIGCSLFVTAFASRWYGVSSWLNDTGFEFVGDIIELIDGVGVFPMTVGFSICGILAAAVMTKRWKRKKEL